MEILLLIYLIPVVLLFTGSMIWVIIHVAGALILNVEIKTDHIADALFLGTLCALIWFIAYPIFFIEELLIPAVDGRNYKIKRGDDGKNNH